LRAVLAGERTGREVMHELATESVRVGPKLAEAVALESGTFQVARARPAVAQESGVGWEALASSLESLTRRLADVGTLPARVKLKVIALEDSDEGGTSELRIEMADARSARQLVARARASWSWREEESPLLTQLDWLEAEIVQGPPKPLFEDVTQAVLGSPRINAQLAPGIPAWRKRIDRAFGVGFLGHQGLAIGDVDGNGLEDLYLCQPGGLPNLLFLHQEDGTAVENSGPAGLDVLDASTAALLIDLDGDGDPDLALAAGDEIALFENRGGGSFQPRALLLATGTSSLAAADCDGDGRLDLFAAAYLGPYEQDATPIPYHDAENGAPNHLFINHGDFEFVDESEERGLRSAPPRFSLAAAWEDFDQDGDPDLYVANDFGRNELWLNDGGRLTSAAAELGVEDRAAGMGVSWGDLDGDGWPDLYVSNMFSSAGSRVAYARRFRPDAEEGERAAFQRHARGNSLFRNLEGRSFEDRSLESHASMGRWAWGALCVELDNDGRPDLVVPNGFVTGGRQDDL
jgi:hypothetical protein